MIHYQLRCDEAHEFDGWFKNSAGFEIQSKGGLISCPVCGGIKIEQALMAPNLARKGRAAAVDPEPVPVAPPVTVVPMPMQAAAGVMPDAVRAVLHKIRTEVEKNCDYVGSNFADEARRIHNGEARLRGIYGETTPGQAEALADDGIEVASIPWLPRADS